MAKAAKHLTPTVTHDLTPERTTCLDCGRHLRADYTNRRTGAPGGQYAAVVTTDPNGPVFF